MTSRILTQYKQQIKDLTLVPAGGGCFEVKFNDELVYSKLKTKQFPDEEEILKLLGTKLAA